MKVDQQFFNDINFICDLALKQGGMQAMPVVDRIAKVLIPSQTAPAATEKKKEDPNKAAVPGEPKVSEKPEDEKKPSA